MAKNYCLPSEYTDKFLDALRSGEITPDKLNSFQTSEERRAFLEPIVGKENVNEVNALIESKLLLKNWKAGMIDAMKSLAGLKPETRTDLITKIERMEKYLTPDEQNRFYQDIASQKLGTEITVKEAEEITKRTKKIQEMKQEFLDNPTEEGRLKMGKEMVDLIDYVKSINPTNQHLILELANLPRALMATADFSAPFRQGWGLMTTKEFWKNLPNMFRYAFDQDAYRALQADLITRPNYDLMRKSKLRISAVAQDITQREEDFTSKIFEKVPGLGRIFKGSEYAYSGFLSKVRADVFDNLIQAAQLKGEDVSSKSQVPKDIAEVINNFSGSGNLGRNDQFAGAVPLLNAIFFAPRKIAAMMNMFNPYTYVKLSPTARIAAIRNLFGSIAATAAVLSLARLFGDDDTVEENPLSSDFGKIRVGNTRYDVSGGNAGYISLISRLITNKTKSTSTGAVQKLGEGYKATTGKDLILQFATNKLSPLGSFAMQLASRKDFNGKPINVPKEIMNRFIPLVIQDIAKVAKDDPTQVVPTLILGSLGVGIGNYNNQTNRDAVIQDTYEKYGTGNIDKATSEIFKSLEKEDGKKLSEAQKTNIKKQYAVYRKFGSDKDLLDKALEIYDLKTNDEKVTMLKNLKKEDYATYQKLISQGRSTVVIGKGTAVPVLISDDVYKKLITTK